MSVQSVAEKRMRGRPRMGDLSDPLVSPLKIRLPVAMLEQVDDYLVALKRLNPQHRVLSRTEGIRDLVQRALDAFREGKLDPFEPMPRRLLEDSHIIALRLTRSIFDEVEEFKEGSVSLLRVVAIQDLLWNGLQLWRDMRGRPGRKGEGRGG